MLICLSATYCQHAFQHFFVGVSPGLYWELGNFNLCVAERGNFSVDNISLVVKWLNCSPEVLEPWCHGLCFFTCQHFLQVLYNFSWVVVGDFGHPSCTNTVSSIYKDHWDNGNVPIDDKNNNLDSRQKMSYHSGSIFWLSSRR